MSDAAINARFTFVKIVVADLAGLETFYTRAFGLQRTGTFETPDIEEVILSGDNGMSLVLYHRKAGPGPALGSAHGPIGFMSTMPTAHSQMQSAAAAQ